MNIPKDPIMLMSFVNTQLRDSCSSLGDFAKSYGVEESEILEKLSAIGYSYNEEANRFEHE